MKAEVVSVGTELIHGFTVDTHAATMGSILAECGIECSRRHTVGDDWDEMVAVLTDALSRADVVITIGGLGPTEDDLTRPAIAAALGDSMVPIPEHEAKLRAFFEMRKLTWTESQLRQCQRPSSARVIGNPNGTAPGLICEKHGQRVIALPGPKGEFGPMAHGPVKEYLAALSGRTVAFRTLKVCGLGESHVESLIKHTMGQANPSVAPYAHLGEVHLRISATAGALAEAESVIEPVETEIRRVLSDAVFGADDDTLESVLLDLLGGKNQCVATAESITGGLLGKRFTDCAGSGNAYLGGAVTYAIPIKIAMLGVRKETLDQHGPVSAETASEMAAGVRKRLGADYGVSTTGNAGPTSDKDDKPIGLVYVAVASPNGTEVEEHRFRGTREDIRHRASQAALVLLRRILLKA